MSRKPIKAFLECLFNNSDNVRNVCNVVIVLLFMAFVIILAVAINATA